MTSAVAAARALAMRAMDPEPPPISAAPSTAASGSATRHSPLELVDLGALGYDGISGPDPNGGGGLSVAAGRREGPQAVRAPTGRRCSLTGVTVSQRWCGRRPPAVRQRATGLRTGASVVPAPGRRGPSARARTWVTASNPDASLMSAGSPNADPKNAAVTPPPHQLEPPHDGCGGFVSSPSRRRRARACSARSSGVTPGIPGGAPREPSSLMASAGHGAFGATCSV